jgi:hypothetical protein
MYREDHRARDDIPDPTQAMKPSTDRPPHIDPKLDRRTWRDLTGRRGEDLRRVFTWLEACDPTLWWEPAVIARQVGLSRRRVLGATERLVREFAVERGIGTSRRYRIITW